MTVPLGAIPNGRWFSLYPPGTPETLGMKVDGTLESSDVKVLVTKHHGEPCRRHDRWSTASPVYPIADVESKTPDVVASEGVDPDQEPAPVVDIFAEW